MTLAFLKADGITVTQLSPQMAQLARQSPSLFTLKEINKVNISIPTGVCVVPSHGQAVYNLSNGSNTGNHHRRQVIELVLGPGGWPLRGRGGNKRRTGCRSPGKHADEDAAARREREYAVESDHFPAGAACISRDLRGRRAESYPSGAGRLARSPVSDEACSFKASLKVG